MIHGDDREECYEIAEKDIPKGRHSRLYPPLQRKGIQEDEHASTSKESA